jgi:hypothetical protein
MVISEKIKNRILTLEDEISKSSDLNEKENCYDELHRLRMQLLYSVRRC